MITKLHLQPNKKADAYHHAIGFLHYKSDKIILSHIFITIIYADLNAQSMFDNEPSFRFLNNLINDDAD